MFWNAFILALREIRRNVLRSFLTTLGIVIGVSSVIVMVTVGNGVTAKVTADIGKLGNNLLMIRPGQMRGPGGGAETAPSFTLDDIKAIQHDVTGLAAVAPSSTQQSTAIFNNLNWSTRVTGSSNEYFIARTWDLQTGRIFSTYELRVGKTVCVIGETVRKKLFNDMDIESVVGQRLRLSKFACEIIGILEAKGQSAMGTDQDDVILMPLSTVQRRLTGKQKIEMIYASLEQSENSEQVIKQIETLLRDRRHLASNEENNFSVMDMKEVINTMTGTTKILTSLLGAVAAVSLLVGGIGIMNIMLVSVTERTREIGTRLAIGALENEVLLQFLVEAVVLSSFGGILGISLALIFSVGLTQLLSVPFLLDFNIVLTAFIFSAAVGVVFGYFPARRAARLDPIDALRHE